MFEYIKNNCKNIKFASNIFTRAAKNGNLENMKWLKENGCPWNLWTFEYAALNGNLENMKWLKENGCPWDEQTFMRAAENGNLENMKWLKENGCPVSYYTRKEIKEKYEIYI